MSHRLLRLSRIGSSVTGWNVILQRVKGSVGTLSGIRENRCWVRIGIEARILMHAANLPGIPWSRGEKEHDVVVGEGGSWDAPDYFRLGPSYGGAGRNHHGRQPVSKLHDSQRHARRRILFSGLPRQKLTLHHHSGKRRVAKPPLATGRISFLSWGGISALGAWRATECRDIYYTLE